MSETLPHHGKGECRWRWTGRGSLIAILATACGSDPSPRAPVVPMAPPPEAPATQAAPEIPGAGDVQLLDAGSEPRRAIRYTPRAGTEETAYTLMSNKIAPQFGAGPVRIGPMTMILHAKLVHQKPTARGSLQLAFEVTGGGLGGGKFFTKGLAGTRRNKSSAKPKERPNGTALLHPRGVATQLQTADEHRQTAAIIGFERSMFGVTDLVVPFPEQPVGAGARWRVDRVTSLGYRMRWIVDYLLLDETDGVLALAVFVRQSFQGAGAPGTPTGFAAFEGEGAGIVVVNPRKLVATSYLRTEARAQLMGQNKAGGAHRPLSASAAYDVIIQRSPTLDPTGFPTSVDVGPLRRALAGTPPIAIAAAQVLGYMRTEGEAMELLASAYESATPALRPALARALERVTGEKARSRADHLAAVKAHVGRKQYADAIRVLDRLLGQAGLTENERVKLRIHRGLALGKSGAHSQQLAEYELALKEAPKNPGALGAVAWVLATSPDDALRDGRRAARLAERMVNLTPKKAESFAIFAAALAEAGQFKRAAEVQRQANALLEPRKALSKIVEYRERLSRYQSGKAWRDKGGGG